jgi:hypothetical protein
MATGLAVVQVAASLARLQHGGGIVLHPVMSDINASAYPNPGMSLHIIKKTL